MNIDQRVASEMGRLIFVVAAVVLAGCFLILCLKARGQEPESPVVVVFGAEWCPHCKLMRAELPKHQGASRSVRYVDVERESATAAKWGVSVAGGIPVAVYARPVDGRFKEIARVKGFSTPAKFSAWVASSERLP